MNNVLAFFVQTLRIRGGIAGCGGPGLACVLVIGARLRRSWWWRWRRPATCPPIWTASARSRPTTPSPCAPKSTALAQGQFGRRAHHAALAQFEIEPLTAVTTRPTTSGPSRCRRCAASGQQKPAVRTQIDPAKAAAVGLGLEEVHIGGANASVDGAKGTLDGPRQSFAVYANDQLLAAPAWNSVILAYRKV